MSTSSHDFVTVDMRGLKAVLVARAQAHRVSVSVLVRAAVARDLGTAVVADATPTAGMAGMASSATSVKLSIRMTPGEAAKLADGARAAGLSRGAYLSGLIADVPALTSGVSRTDHLTALIASCAELSTLSRNIRHLMSLLREGNVRAAQEYREMLDTLVADVRGHLTLAAHVLSDLQPRRHGVDASARSTTRPIGDRHG